MKEPEEHVMGQHSSSQHLVRKVMSLHVLLERIMLSRRYFKFLVLSLMEGLTEVQLFLHYCLMTMKKAA